MIFNRSDRDAPHHKMNVYVVMDKTLEECSHPICAANHGVAVRIYRKSMLDVPKYDRDSYVLFCIGMLDTISMELLPAVPQQIETNMAVVEDEEVE